MRERQLYVLGDIHGHRDKMVELLEEAGLMGGDGAWKGKDAALILMGDFFDRGPNGLGAIELAMRLQEQAPAAGGRSVILLGNHEVLLLSAYIFGRRATTGPGGTFLADWEINGGVSEDLEGLTQELVSWLMDLPAMARVGDLLLAHADAGFYLDYGRSVDEVNRALRALLRGRDVAAWDRLLEEFAERNRFHNHPDGTLRAREFLGRFGGRLLVHGHTPISLAIGKAPEEVTAPLEYAGGRCVNVDAGLYLGGPGFLYRPRSVGEPVDRESRQ